MGDIVRTIYDVVFSSAFATAFWVFVGIVAGALIQYLLSRIFLREQIKNALVMLKTEIEMNLSEVERFEKRIRF